ncbi:MAG: hypothetical protein GY906_08475, partial [bacterium]|nr:hypothetical protein [bacterium]
MFLVEILMLANAAVTPVAVTDSVPMDSPRWRFEAQENRVEQYLGRQSLFLRGGWALLEDVEMLDGVIEFDVAIPKERGFSGAVWRVQDQANMEQFYLRHHQSGNP